MSQNPIILMPSRVLAALGSASVAAMLLHTVVEVVSRTAFNAPLSGTLEIVTFWYMPLIAFIGMWLGYTQNEHISVDLLTSRLKPGAQWVLHIFVSLLMFVFLTIVIWYSTHGAITAANRGEYMGIDRVPIWPVKFIVPIALLAFAIALVVQTVRIIRRGYLPLQEAAHEGV